MSNTRVLIISHGHPAFSLGGAEVASYNLHNGIHQLPDWESHYLARVAPPVSRHNDSPFLSLRQKEREILWFANDYEHFRMSNRNTQEIAQEFVRYVADVRPDLVHFHHFLGIGVECIYALKKAFPALPIVVTFHEYLSICHHHGQMVKTSKTKLCYRASPAECNGCFPHIPETEFFKRETFIKTFLELADFYISPSQFLIERYVDWGLPREKFRLIENGLNIEEIVPARPLRRSGGRRNRFAYFGQVTEFKGLHILLDAIARIPDKDWGDDSVLMVFGGNLERQPKEFQENFKLLMEKAGNRARFYGSYTSAELPNLIKDADWVIVPSIWWENSPIVIQEAFLHRRPIITSNIGGMAEKVTHNVSGLHFRSGSVEDLVDRLTEVLRSNDLWERLQNRIPKPIDQAECARQHIEIYQRLLGQVSADRDGNSTDAASTGTSPADTGEEYRYPSLGVHLSGESEDTANAA